MSAAGRRRAQRPPASPRPHPVLYVEDLSLVVGPGIGSASSSNLAYDDFSRTIQAP